ncbi:hypothetical protein V6N11_076982 [Hibiscus sabdariffa]|uniref:Uncharacterized protein n=1 Tax=Hibiscus sabdariffa TaxID=183260 RepID=A0ABR2TBT7_9ROSI
MLEHDGEAVRYGLNDTAIGHRNLATRGGNEARLLMQIYPDLHCFLLPAQSNNHSANSLTDQRIGTTVENNVIEAVGYDGNSQNKIMSNPAILGNDELNNKMVSKNLNAADLKISKSLEIRDMASALSNPPQETLSISIDNNKKIWDRFDSPDRPRRPRMDHQECVNLAQLSLWFLQAPTHSSLAPLARVRITYL